MLVPVVPMGLTIPPGLEYLLPCAGAHVRQVDRRVLGNGRTGSRNGKGSESHANW